MRRVSVALGVVIVGTVLCLLSGPHGARLVSKLCGMPGHTWQWHLVGVTSWPFESAGPISLTPAE